MIDLIQSISEHVDKHRKEAITFLQELIRTPSPTGKEGEVAELLSEKMRESGFNAVKVDRLNDVMSTIKGRGNGKELLFNGHIDHVPEGDMIEPYSGKLMDGSIFGTEGEVVYGRAASDMKGAVAAMVMAGTAINDLGFELEGNFKVAAVSQEETGGFGTISTIQDAQFLGDLVVIGEATNMEMALGHRGSTAVNLVVKGRSCHASAPERGVNALYKAIDLISRIKSQLEPQLPDDPIYGRTSIAVTKIEVIPGVRNVVPEECIFCIDCRNNPKFPAEKLKIELERLIGSIKTKDPEFEALVISPAILRGTKGFNGFYTHPEKNPIVKDVQNYIEEILGRKPTLSVWKFGTDGRFYSWQGIPVIGFGPGEEKFAHTHQDHVKVVDFLNSVKTYTFLACKICNLSNN